MIHDCACGPKTVLIKRTFSKTAISEVMMGCGGVGWGGHVNVPCTSCMRSLGSLLRDMFLRCRDLWCCCYVTCYYAAEISGVVATWHVSTLQRSLVLLLRYLLLRCWWGGVGWGIVVFKKRSLGSLCSKSKDLLLYVKCWQWQYVNGHSRLQQKTISTLKRLVWKKMKKCPTHFAKNPHETQIFARKFGQIVLIEVCISL